MIALLTEERGDIKEQTAHIQPHTSKHAVKATWIIQLRLIEYNFFLLKARSKIKTRTKGGWNLSFLFCTLKPFAPQHTDNPYCIKYWILWCIFWSNDCKSPCPAVLELGSFGKPACFETVWRQKLQLSSHVSSVWLCCAGLLKQRQRGRQRDGGREMSGLNQNQWKPVTIPYNYLIFPSYLVICESGHLYSFRFTVCDKPSGKKNYVIFLAKPLRGRKYLDKRHRTGWQEKLAVTWS